VQAKVWSLFRGPCREPLKKHEELSICLVGSTTLVAREREGPKRDAVKKLVPGNSKKGSHGKKIGAADVVPGIFSNAAREA